MQGIMMVKRKTFWVSRFVTLNNEGILTYSDSDQDKIKAEYNLRNSKVSEIRTGDELYLEIVPKNGEKICIQANSQQHQQLVQLIKQLKQPVEVKEDIQIVQFVPDSSFITNFDVDEEAFMKQFSECQLTDAIDGIWAYHLKTYKPFIITFIAFSIAKLLEIAILELLVILAAFAYLVVTVEYYKFRCVLDVNLNALVHGIAIQQFLPNIKNKLGQQIKTKQLIKLNDQTFTIVEQTDSRIYRLFKLAYRNSEQVELTLYATQNDQNILHILKSTLKEQHEDKNSSLAQYFQARNFRQQSKSTSSVIDPQIQIYYQICDEAKQQFEFYLPLSVEWTMHSESRGYLIHTRYDEKTKVTLSRGEGILPYSIADIFLIIEDVKNRGDYDKLFESGYEVQRWNDDLAILYQKFKRIVLVSSRDFTLISRVYRSEGKLLAVAKSINYPNLQEQKGAVRATLHFAGWQLEDQGAGQTKAIYMTMMDPKVNAPAKVLEQIMKDQAHCVEKLKLILDKRK